jgi:hypothetical protein
MTISDHPIFEKLHIKVNTKSFKEDSQDELDHATNWVRAFQKIYTEIKWLNSYAIINEIAAQKVQKKFMKSFFVLKDNIIDKNLTQFQRDLEIVKRTNIKGLMKDIKRMTADFFTGGDVSKAKILLEGKNNEMPRDKLQILSLLTGGIVVFFWIMFLCLVTTDTSDKQIWKILQH